VEANVTMGMDMEMGITATDTMAMEMDTMVTVTAELALAHRCSHPKSASTITTITPINMMISSTTFMNLGIR
jgi:hypothetical protein